MPRHALDRVTPRAHLHVASFDGDLAALGQLAKSFLGTPLDGTFRLIALLVDVLPEVALAMQQRDSDHWKPEISGRTERVASKHAEPTTVGRDPLLQADFHGEVRDCRGRLRSIDR